MEGDHDGDRRQAHEETQVGFVDRHVLVVAAEDPGVASAALRIPRGMVYRPPMDRDAAIATAKMLGIAVGGILLVLALMSARVTVVVGG